MIPFRHEFAHLFSGKSRKTAATRAALFDSSMHRIVCRLGLRPRPHWGSLQRSPDSIAGGPTSKGKDEGRGEGGSSSFALGRKKKTARMAMIIFTPR